MTDMKKTAKDKAPAKRKELQLNKETLKDLQVRRAGPAGGARPNLLGTNTSTDPGCG